MVAWTDFFNVCQYFGGKYRFKQNLSPVGPGWVELSGLEVMLKVVHEVVHEFILEVVHEVVVEVFLEVDFKLFLDSLEA